MHLELLRKQGLETGVLWPMCSTKKFPPQSDRPIEAIGCERHTFGPSIFPNKQASFVGAS